MDKAFTLRLLRCFVVGLSAFVMILVTDITIQSPFDVAGYVLSAGALWYVVELVLKPGHKPSAPTSPPPVAPSPIRQKKSKPKANPLGEDHFD